MQKIIQILLVLSFISCAQENEEFKLCGMGIAKPYYVTGLKYEGEIYRIEKEIREKYINVNTNNSGIAKVRFKVNCDGIIGDLHYEEYDDKYFKTQLNDSIKLQLIESVSKLSNWIPGIDAEGDPINSHAFLSFRIRNGEIVEILPK